VEGTLIHISGGVSSRSAVRVGVLAGYGTRCSDHPSSVTLAGDSGVEKFAEEGHFPSRRQAVTSRARHSKGDPARRRILRSVFSPLGSVIFAQARIHHCFVRHRKPRNFPVQIDVVPKWYVCPELGEAGLKTASSRERLRSPSLREYDVHRACSHIDVRCRSWSAVLLAPNKFSERAAKTAVRRE